MTGFRSLFSAFLSGPRPAFPALPRPIRPICFLGDIHGRLDLLERMLATITAREDVGALRLVVLGDMIDRGPDAASVLGCLRDLTAQDPANVICLMGNHEQMLLDFLDDPAAHGARWMSYGGAETLKSFGIDPWAKGTGREGADRMAGLAADLRRAMPEGTESWLRALPLSWAEGRIVATHAGADPARAIADQDADTLLWGHRAFARQTRHDGIWVAHGHTVVEAPHAVDGRIAVDTGAWRTGRLSAAVIGQQGLQFVDVVEDRQAPMAPA